MTYVYPVVSRRAGGVSVGINLCPNNACNWQCVYCQVEGLHRGAAPQLDLAQLEGELGRLLEDILHGDYLSAHVPEGARKLRDLALSGNGEPTSSSQFVAVLEVIGRVRQRFGLDQKVPTVLITNGSLVERSDVQRGLTLLKDLAGIVWFKVDGGTDERLNAIHGTHTRIERHLDRLCLAASLCPTFVQSCWFRTAGAEPPDSELDAYVAALGRVVARGVALEGVWLYTVARPCVQPGGDQLTAVTEEFLRRLATRLEALGLLVRTTA
jgi:wyosine [tRNA(Phe)-imidazoG37] synthetase (radical SAM superfamily)